MSNYEIGRVDERPSNEPSGYSPPATRHSSLVTLADGLMLPIAVLAAWLRFGDLARLPLSAAEATAALAS